MGRALTSLEMGKGGGGDCWQKMEINLIITGEMYRN